MMVLTEDNKPVNVTTVSGGEVHFGVLDFSKPKTPDYMWKPLVFIDTFVAPGVDLEIGDFRVTLPFRWSIMIGHGDQVDLISIEDLIGNTHNIFAFNPMTSYMPRVMECRVRGIHKNANWSIPTMNKEWLLLVPLGYEKGQDGQPKNYPLCIMTGDSPKIPDSSLSMADIL